MQDQATSGPAAADAGADRTLPDVAVAVSVRDLHVRYPGAARDALAGVSLDVRRGEFLGITGPSGAGKSTLCLCLKGLVPSGQFSGRVTVAGRSVAPGSPYVEGSALVFQNPETQIIGLTVAEDVAFGLQNQRVPAAERAERVAEVLSRYGLDGHAHHPAHLLSGGQKQLLAIAGVLVMRPARVVFDEPTTLLDLANRRRIARVIEELEQDVVVVSHDLDLLAGFDRVLVLEDGRIVADGTPQIALAWYSDLVASTP